MKTYLAPLLVTLAFMLPVEAVFAAELVYFKSAACSVCERWDEEVGEIYSKTSESSVLPLRMHDIHDERPEDFKFVRGVVYTPTFVMIEDGREVGRIVGYIRDYFFWEQVNALMKKIERPRTPAKVGCLGDEAGQNERSC